MVSITAVETPYCHSPQPLLFLLHYWVDPKWIQVDLGIPLSDHMWVKLQINIEATKPIDPTLS